MRKNNYSTINLEDNLLISDGAVLAVKGLGLIFTVWAVVYLLVLPLVNVAMRVGS